VETDSKETSFYLVFRRLSFNDSISPKREELMTHSLSSNSQPAFR